MKVALYTKNISQLTELEGDKFEGDGLTGGAD
jgi:hypothetical protein